MTWLVMVLVMVVGAVMQLIGPGPAFFGHAKLPVLLCLTLYYALNRETETMLVAAFLAGLLQDVLSPIPLGYSSLCFMAIGLLAGLFRKIMLTDSLLTSLLFGAAAAGAATVIQGIMLARDGLIEPPALWMFMRIIGSMLLGTVCAPCVFLIAGKLDHMVGNVSRREDPVLNEIE